MFTVDKNIQVNHDLIWGAIKYNEEKKIRFDKLEDYYLGIHSILKRSKGDTSVNNKIVVNHASYIVDTNIGYLLGNPVEYQASEGYEIQPILDHYKRQTINDLDSEIATDISKYGQQLEYVFANELSNPESAKIDNRNGLVIYDDTVKHNKLFGMMYSPVYDNNKNIKHYDVTFLDKNKIIKYECSKDNLIKKGIEQPHIFGDVPLIEYRNNPNRMGDFEKVLTLIDAYNILQSDRVNNHEQLVDAILCLYGMDLTGEQLTMLKQNRVLAGIPEGAKAEYLIKKLNETEVDVLKKNIENDIHKISMTPNMGDENFVGNSSGVAIRYKLLPFEQNIKNKERYFEKGLMERFRLYNNFLIFKSQMPGIVPVEEVDAIFKRNLPSNDYEISQMINNLLDVVDKETLIAQLSFIKDAKEIVALKEAEASKTSIEDSNLRNNEIDDLNNSTDD